MESDLISDESFDFLLTVLREMLGEVNSHHEKFLGSLRHTSTSAEVPAAKQDASTEVDLSLFSSSAGSVTESPFLLHPTDEASSSYSFLGYCSVFSLLVGCTYLGYLLIGYFLVPLPPAECLLNTDLLPELSSSVPPVSISNPDSDSSLPSTNTLIIVSVGVTVLVITLWCCSVPVPFVPLLV